MTTTWIDGAQAAIDAHTHAMLLDLDCVEPKATAFWHLLASMMEYADANGIDFDATVSNVRAERPSWNPQIGRA